MAEANPIRPVLKGRLSKAENTAIQAMKSGAPFRTTISINAALALAALRAAASEKRDFSNFCELALSEYKHAAPDVKAELGAMIDELGVERSLNILLRAKRRKAA